MEYNLLFIYPPPLLLIV